METKFYVGQMVRSNKFGKGVVVSIETSQTHAYPIVCEFKRSNHSALYTHEGRHWEDEDVDLFPADPPRVVLTEWQRNQLYENGINHWSCDGQFLEMLDIIESILSEPPKYQPKQGEAVIFRDRNDCPWSASVATGICWRIYYYGDTLDAFEVRPFDA